MSQPIFSFEVSYVIDSKLHKWYICSIVASSCLCILKDTCDKLFCDLKNFYASEMQEAGVTKSLVSVTEEGPISYRVEKRMLFLTIHFVLIGYKQQLLSDMS